MAHETRRLAEYAAQVTFAELPDEVVQRAKDIVADSVATMIFGSRLPWSRMISAYATRSSAAGRSRILGSDVPGVVASAAALANGAFAHAFELDNLTRPSSGVHPGAVLVSSGLAVAQERGSSGAELIEAFVAGAEVIIRIGRATRHSNEARGFHAPGTTGPFGSAVVAGRLAGLGPEAMTNALGIAGSMSAGLLEFARSGTGAMVKRLHLARAAESGVIAAALAADGFTGPETVLEGEFGFLNVFCIEPDRSQLTAGLGETYVSDSILIKRFACHITAHTSVQAMLELRTRYGFTGDDVAAIAIAGNDRMASVNSVSHPRDIMMAQYSVPFCVAIAAYRELLDPRSFEDALDDRNIGALAERVRITRADGRDHTALTVDVTVTLHDGRVFETTVDGFKGTPQDPLDQAELSSRFDMLTAEFDESAMTKIFERIQALEEQPDLHWLGA